MITSSPHWNLCFSSIPIKTEENLLIMFCFDSQMQQIKSFACGLKPITTQNIIVKLNTAIQNDLKCENSKPSSIFLCSDSSHSSLSKSKSYKRFLARHRLKGFDEQDELPTNYKEDVKQFLKAFHNFLLEGILLQDALQNHPTTKARSFKFIIEDYVQSWNKSCPTRVLDVFPNTVGLVGLERLTSVHAEFVRTSPFDLDQSFEEQQQLEQLTSRMEQWMALTQQNHQESQLAQFTIEEIVNEIQKDVKELLPKNKKKHLAQSLRDPISYPTFQIFVLNAGSSFSYQKNVHAAQLRIAYTFLYYLGLRLNELGTLSLDELEKSIEEQSLSVRLHKTNHVHKFTLSKQAIQELKDLRKDFYLLRHQKNFQYLFGKHKPPHPKSLLRIVNNDLKKTCKTCQITGNIRSHSFRISVISKLLRITDVQNVAEIIGHQDIRSTMTYSRYRLSPSEIQKLHEEAEDSLRKNV